MGGNAYRSKGRQVHVVLPLVTAGHLDGISARWGTNLTDTIKRLVMEEVGRHGDGGSRPDPGFDAAADFGGPRPSGGGGGEDASRVDAGDGGDSQLTGPFGNPPLPIEPQLTPAQKLAALVDADLARKATTSTPVVDPFATTVPVEVDDPWEAEGRPAGRDSRGRILNPQIRDPFIDTP